MLPKVEILHIEDSPDQIRLTKIMFAKRGKVQKNLHPVTSYEEAQDFLYRRGAFSSAPRPDLVLLDLNMPGRDGRELLKEIKADPSLRSIPIIVLSSSAANEDVAHCYTLGANCYFTKPIDIEGFAEMIDCIEKTWFQIGKIPDPTLLEAAL